jgi:dCMP deaminase
MDIVKINSYGVTTDWDQYFLEIARIVSLASKCWSRQIGAVLVKDKAIISTGFNGPPRGMKPCTVVNEFGDGATFTCPRRKLGYKSGEGLHICPAAHAERNALIQAARTGISTKGTTLYCYCGQVCKDCAIEIANSGVKELVFLANVPDYDTLAGEILAECGVNVRRVNFA